MTQYINEQYWPLAKTSLANKNVYASAEPFPFITLPDFFNPEMLDSVLEEFPDLSRTDAVHFHNQNEMKFAGKGENTFGSHTREFMHFLNSEPFLRFIQDITGIEEILLGDPYFVGGGLHEIKRGGLLKVHADFNKHRETGLDRRVNLLIYLNKNWDKEYGGHFELWDREMKNCEKKVLPTFNTLALFTTTDFSYHGHPEPLNCPTHMSRKSLALYYYSNGRPNSEINLETGDHSTLFQPRPGTTDSPDLSHKNKWSGKSRLIAKELSPPFLVKSFRKLKKVFNKE